MSAIKGMRGSILWLFVAGVLLPFSAEAQTSAMVTATPSPATFGQPVTLKATVAPSSATGKVTFYDGTAIVGIAAVSSGQATLVTSQLASGVRSIRAYYSGDTNDAAATSPIITETVNTLPQVGFAPGQSYGSGINPVWVATGDFNGDGKQDLVVVNSGSNNVAVFIGNGDGTFHNPVDYVVGTTPFSIAVSDFNGDGKADLAVANNVSNNVSILIGNGDGTFQPAVTSIATGTNPLAIAVGDFNGDGKADLAVANGGSGNVSVFKGNGDGTFQAGMAYTTGANPQSVAIGDFNGDGKTDLAVANSATSSTGNGSLSVLLGNGDGTFQAAVNFNADVNPISVAVADFNGDGKPDLAAANLNSGDVSVLLGNGNGTFQTAVNYATGSRTTFVAVGDFNGDGKPDLAAANSLGNSVSVLINNGTGTFQAAANYAASNPYGLAVGDFTGDGRTDLAVASGLGSFNIMPGATPATTTALTSSLNPAVYGQGVTLTAAVAPAAATGSVTFYDGTTLLGTKRLSGGTAALTVFLPSGSHALRVYYGGDIVYTGSTSATLTQAVTTVAANGFQAPVSYTAGMNPTAVAVGDFNGDGKADLAVNNNSGSNVSVFLGNGDGTFRAGVNYSTGASPTFVAVADFNGDGKPDLAVSSAQGLVSVLLGNGDGTFQAPVSYATGADAEYVAVGDFNGDGKADLVTANKTGGSVSVLLGHGDGTFGAATNINLSGSPVVVAVGDLNGDGIADLAVGNYGLNTVSVLLGHGDGTFGIAASYAAGSGPTSLAIGDFNGDGKADVAAADYGSGGSVSVLYGSGGGVLGAPVSYAAGGSAPSSVVSEDFNGDGKPDLAVANPGSNTVNVILNNGGAMFQAPVASGVGMNPWRLATGDFNGDGRVDMAVVNMTSQTVSILLGKAPVATTTMLTSSPNPSVYGQSVTLTATVAPSSATGNVTFYDSATVLGSGAVAGGQAVLSTSLLASGSRSLRAYYSGNTTGAASTSNTVTQTVNAVGSVGFHSLVDYNAGNQPSAIAIGDFNGDGKADLVVADYLTNKVAVMLNKGNGVFLPAVFYAVGYAPSAVVVGDFNGDGKADLAVANFSDNTVSILLGNGDGTFTSTGSVYGTDLEPQSITVGDFNGDGYTDLAVATGAGLNVLSGNGNGTFQAAMNYATGGVATAVAAGDFNGDGKTDLAVTLYPTSSTQITTSVVAIFLGNGNGSFQPALNYTVGSTPKALVVADFNGDGKLDIASGNQGSSNVSVLIGNGNGTFVPVVNYAIGNTPVAMVAGDFNGDGKVDLAVANNNFFSQASGNSVSVLLGQGNGTFLTPVNYRIVTSATTESPVAVAIGDFNGDGRADLAVANSVFTVSILRNAAPLGTTVSTTTLTSSANPSTFGQGVTLTASVTGAGATGFVTFFDGVVPLATKPLVSGSAALNNVLLASGVRTLKASYSGDTVYAASTSPAVTQTVNAVMESGFGTAATIPTVTAPTAIARGDFNGDGKTDLAVLSGGGTVMIFLGRGDGTFQPGASYSPTAETSAKAIGLGDFNNDGIQDLLVAGNLWLGNGDGTFQAGLPTLLGGDVTAVADFNGDGKADVALSSGFVALGNGDGTFSVPVAIVNGSFGAVGDFNGDGKADLAFLNTNGNVVGIVLGNGDGTFRTGGTYTVPQPGALAVGDFNNDGKADLAVTSWSGLPATTGNVAVLSGNGDGTFQAPILYPVNGVPYSAAAGDFNGDGRTDFAVGCDVISGTAAYFVEVFLAGNLGNPSSYNVGNSPMSMTVGDFNGDGRTDIATANYYDNTVSILLGRATGALATTTGLAVTPSPAQYGQPLTLTATVTPSTATGTVTFMDFTSVVLGTATVSGGTATFTTAATALAAGSHSFTAIYNGDTNDLPSTSPVVMQTLAFGATTTALTIYSGSVYGLTSLMLTATVSPAAAAGTVTFYSGSAVLGTATLFNGTATFTEPPPAAGVYSLKAVYAGALNYAGSTSSVLTQTISQATGVVTLDSSANPSITGGSVTLRSTVSPEGATGSVTFMDGTATLGTVSLSGGASTFTTAALALGTHALSAVYSGDTNVAAATSPTLTQVVNPQRTATSQMTLTSSANPVRYGQSVTLRGTVSPSAATGHVTFYDGVAVLGKCAISGGVATLTSILPASGARSLRAYYSGDATYAGSSSALVQTVTAEPGSGLGAAAVYPAGMGPQAEVAADFNGDGKTDLAIADEAGNTITVLLGNGDGTFRTVMASPAVSTPAGLVVGDFNGDGLADLALVNASGDTGVAGTISVLLANGDGTFRPGVSYQAGYSPQTIVTADFNGDGNADLAVTDAGNVNGGNAVSVLLGNGDGTFQAAVPYAAVNSAAAAVVGDFNGDGKPDIAVTFATGGSTVGVLLGNGDGTFQAPITTAGNLVRGQIATTDFNGDGKADLALADPANHRVIVLAGNGDGTFQAATYPDIPTASGAIPTPTALAMADFNGDGNADIAFTDVSAQSGNSLVYRLLGHGDGTFEPTYGYSVGNNPLSLVTGDFNGDGIADVVTGNTTDSTVSVLLGVVGQTAQTISFNSSGTVTVNELTVTLTATASSGLLVTFDSTTPSVCTVLSNTVSLLTTGTCTITAYQSGNATYAAATPVTQSFLVNPTPMAQTITFPGIQNTLLSAGTVTISATASSGLTVSFTSATTPVCTVSGSTVTLLAAGTCSIIASQPGNSIYSAAPQYAQSFLVQLPQTITFAQLLNSPFGTHIALSISASSGLMVSVVSNTTTICTVSGGYIVPVAVGMCSVTASQAGNSIYAAAMPVTQSFMVTQGPQTITFAALSSVTLPASAFALTATASSGLPVTFASTTTSICTVSGSMVTPLAAGTCSITASQAGNANYMAATPVMQSFTINPAPSTGSGGGGGGGGGGAPGGSSAVTATPATVTISAPVGGGTASQTVVVSYQTYTAGAPTFTTNSSVNQGLGWLSVSPASGTMTQASYAGFLYTYTANITITVTSTGIAAGSSYMGTVNVSAGGGIASVGVTMNVTAQPTVYTVAPTSLNFTYRQGDSFTPAPQSIGVFSTPAGAMFTASAASGASWLSVMGSGTTPGGAGVSVNVTGLNPGTYNGAAVITPASGTPISVPVKLTVVNASPQLSVSSGVQNFVGAANGSITVSNSGGGTLQFAASVGAGTSWLKLSGSGSGSATPSMPASVGFTVDPTGLAPGVYSGEITVNDVNSSAQATVMVTLAIGASTPSIQLSQSGMQFSAVTGGAAPPSQTFTVTSSGPWTAVAQSSGWLKASASGPVVTVSASANGLATGTYYGSISVGSQMVSVVLNVTAKTAGPGVVLSTGGLIFTSSAAQTVNLFNPGAAGISYSASVFTVNGGNWLTVSSANGTANPGMNSFSISTNFSGLSGLQTGSVTFVFGDGSMGVIQVIAIAGGSSGHLILHAQAACTGGKPSYLIAVVRQPLGGSTLQTAGPQVVQAEVVDDCGNAVTAAGGGSVQMAFSDADPTVGLHDVGGGIWESTWTPVNASASVTAQVAASEPGLTLGAPASVTVAVQTAAADAAGQPTGVANAASAGQAVPGVVAPMSYVAIYGTGLAGGGSPAATSLPLPTTLNGTQLLLGGLPMPLLYASTGQVNALVPEGLAPNASYPLVVMRGGTQSVPVPITVAELQPGVYTVDTSGSGAGIVTNALTGALINAGNPAHAGDYLVIYCTGLGVVRGPNGETEPGDGAAAPSSPIYSAAGTVTVSIGGVNAPVLFAGLTPTFAGLYQVNVQMPGGAAAGSEVPLVVTVADSATGVMAHSNSVTVAAQ